MRKNVYWSERLDKDLIKYMGDNNFDDDFSQAIKKLMRDGIKYREGEILNVNNQNVFSSELPKPESPMGHKRLSSEYRGEVAIDFSDIATEKKEVELSELEERLNSI